MIFEERPAPAGMDDAIGRVWFFEGLPPRPYEKILPMPFAHLIVNLSGPYRTYDRRGAGSIVPDAFVSGLQSEYLVIESPAQIRHLGVEFSPTGLAVLAPDLAGATSDRVRDAASILPGVSQFAARARTIDDGGDAVAALDRYLRRLPLHPADPVASAAVAHIHADSERPIGELASELGTSNHALVDRFRRATGTTPKRHARIVRFHRLIDAVHASGGPPDWATLAVSAGYYDQPHVIREFRAFSGWTPAEYYRLVGQHGADAAHFVPLEHVPTYASS